MTIPWLDALVRDAHATLTQLPRAHLAWTYLRSRGVESIDETRLGWLDGPHGLVEPCPPDFWTWFRRHGWAKLVFPITDPFGVVHGIQLRNPLEKGYVDYFHPKGKQISPPSFGLHVALPAAWVSERLILVEGVFDYFALRPYAADVLAILTSMPTLAIRQLCARYVRTVVMLTDMDGPGRRGAYRTAGLPIPAEFRRPSDRVLPLPPYQVLIPAYTAHDPGDLYAAGKRDELQRLAGLGRLPTISRPASDPFPSHP